VTTSGADYKTGLIVDYFGSVTTGRASQSFGNIAAGSSYELNDKKTGDFKANGSSDILLSASLFDDSLTHSVTTTTHSLAFATTSTPASGEVYFACSPGATVIAPVLLGTSPEKVALSQFVLGTVTEAADTAQTHSCILTYGGGATEANNAYSSTVVVSIAAHS
jgi:hypothetical protein